MIEFRKANPGDAVLLATLRQRVWEETYRGIYPDEKIDGYDIAAYAGRDASRMEDSAQRYYLAFDGETCVGYFSYGPYNYGTYKDFDLCLNSLYFLKSHQRRGLGYRVLDQIQKYAREQGMDKFFCGCSIHNGPARAFYEKMGGLLAGECGGHENKAEGLCYYEFYLGEETI